MRASFLNHGFAHYNAGVAPEVADSFREFREAFDQLPPDPKAKNGERNRRFGVWIYDPIENHLFPTTRHSYLQSVKYNAEECGELRHFAELGDLANNRYLRWQIGDDLDRILPLKGKYAYEFLKIGSHMIRMYARPGQPGLPSPPRPHRDGESATWVHLQNRVNVTGGENWICLDPKGEQMLARFTMVEPGETALVRDEAVMHHVTNVEVEPGMPFGYRDVLLIDVMPLVAEEVDPFDDNEEQLLAA